MDQRAQLADLRNRASSFWDGLPLGRRVALVAACIGLVIVLVSFLGWAQTVEYTTLYSNLDERDAAEVVARLKEAKVPYQLDAGGSTIRVPASHVHDTRLQLAADGLPKGGGIGFELFDKTNFAVTDFAQRLNYQRALEGELARTISQLAPVAGARVHIVIPQPELYKSKERDSSASVVVNLRPGKELEEKQVRAIANLVAGSVEGLKTSNLTIVDTGGNILSEGLTDSLQSSTSSAKHLEIQRAYERQQENRVRVMLDRVLGPQKAVVTVNALLDWDQVEQYSEIYAPGGVDNQLRSLKETREKYPYTGSTVGGIPGGVSNVPGYVGVDEEPTDTPASASPPADYERVDLVQNYEISRLTETVQRAPGGVKRLSVAVVLDEMSEPAQVAAISDLVATAVGIDTDRGDRVSVTSLKFERSLEQAEAVSAEQAREMELYRTIAFGVAAFIAVVALLLFLRRLGKDLKPVQVVAAGEPSVKVITQSQPVLPRANSGDLAYNGVLSLAKAQPQAVALVVKTWLDQK